MMRKSATFTYLSILILSLSASFTFAGDHKHTDTDHVHTAACENDLLRQRDIKLIPSGRDSALIPYYRKKALERFGPNGVLERLGLANPPHELQMVPGGQLMMLAALGRHAVPHFVDGAQIINPMGSAGVLEFVTPGCPTCRSMYTDLTEPKKQVSIMDHVSGHNDFAVWSVYEKIRNIDPIAESLRLSDSIDRYYREIDHDEVSQYYQYLQTLVHLQDLQRNTFEHPNEFTEEKYRERLRKRNRLNKELKAEGKISDEKALEDLPHPTAPTSNILQFIVNNLPLEAQEYQQDLARNVERMERILGAYTATKIMNEGWASMMQEIVFGHSSDAADDDFNLHVAELMSGVVGMPGKESISNPYYFGRLCWRLLREKFNKREDIVKLDPLQRDRKFIDYAHGIIAEYNDYDFIQLALDDNWIHSNDIKLVRKVRADEGAPSAGDKELAVVLSTNTKRIKRRLAEVLANRANWLPIVKLYDSKALGYNVFNMKQEPHMDRPLQRDSMAQALWVMAKLLKKPVSIKTDYTKLKVQLRNWYWDQVTEYDYDTHKELIDMWLQRGIIDYDSFVIHKTPMRFEVDPNGKLKVFLLNESGEDVSALDPKDPRLQEFQDALDFFALDEQITHASDKGFAKFLNKIEEHDLDLIMNQLIQSRPMIDLHARTYHSAIDEYLRMVRKRLERSILLSVQGKIKRTVTKNGVRLKVLPTVPEFEYDQEMSKIIERIRKAKSKVPVDKTPWFDPSSKSFSFHTKMETDLPSFQDDDVDVDVRPGDPGDTFWRPKPGGGGPGGKGASDEAMDPSEVEIPHEIYAKYLLKGVELPNLEPKEGESQSDDTTLEGAVRQPYGQRVHRKMVGDLMTVGQLFYKKEVEDQGLVFDPSKYTAQQFYAKGLELMPKSAIRVKAREPVERPEMNAVVFIELDLSGSMSDQEINTAKNIAFNLKYALLQRYDQVQFVYITFDTEAHVYEDEEQFFKARLGGGTVYAAGIAKAREIAQEKYPQAVWDRYSLTMGDSGCFEPERSADEFRQISEEFNYSGYIHLGPSDEEPTQGLYSLIKAYTETNPKASRAAAVNSSTPELSGVKALEKIYGNQPVSASP